MDEVREIWPADADPVLIAPLTSFYPYGIKIGSSGSLAFSTQLDVISPASVYDKIDYKLREGMTGEELYGETVDALVSGFKGGQQYWKWQAKLMIAYKRSIDPPEAPE